VWTILAIGQDYRGEGDQYLYGLADVIRLIRIDFSKGTVSLLAIPRDLWVKFPDLMGITIDNGKINQAYFYGTPAMGHYNGRGGGAGLLADTLSYNYDIFPDHYVVVSMNAFVHIIDAVGGIDVTLTEAVDGNVKFNMGYYPAGTYHFNGSQALMFSRIRYGYTELKRIDFESIVMKALYEKVNTPSVKVDLFKIAQIFLEEKAVLTDLTPANLATLVCVATTLDIRDVKMATLPKETITGQMIFSAIQNDDTFVYMPDNMKVQQVIDDFKAGIWP
jgi:LCP family protein required for cell wall assembly